MKKPSFKQLFGILGLGMISLIIGILILLGPFTFGLSSSSSFLFSITFIIICMLSIGTALLISFRLNNDVAASLMESYETGKKEGTNQGIWQVINSLDQGESALSAIYLWLYKYRHGKSTVDEAARIFNQTVNRLIEKIDLHPLGKLGEIIEFDPRLHRTNQPYAKPGDKMRVIEVGWQVGQQQVRKPMLDNI
jgi:hypothetical protein